MQHNQASHIHKAMYIQTLDPGAVGAKVMWLDTTSGVVWKKRNDANDGWDLLADVGALVTFLAAFDIKASVRAATTANITLSGAQTIDGVSVIAGERVLVKNQSTGSENGIYVCASGAWARATDADVSAEVTAGMLVPVTEGSTQADTFWLLTTNDPITLGSTTLTFVQFGAGTANIAPLVIDNANTVSQRNGANIQTLKIYATDDGAGNARWLQTTNTSTIFEILSTASGSTGIQNLLLRVAGGGNGITLSTGTLIPTSDRGLSLGSGSNRWDTITGFDVVSNGGIFRSQNNWDLHGYGAGLMSMSAGGATGGTLRITLGDQGTGTALQRPSGTDYFEIKDGAGTNYKGLRAQFVEPQPVTVANLPASPRHGMLVSVTDSNTTTWGATIAGGGSNKVLAYYNGTNWTVAAI